ncbi:MAG: sigma-54-dependent Fis family transcriptional regulator, partial [Lentisphaeria bacterium]|nr:sigma-54-dependent Fis family transcriptional regulator [Lentisphaeria bacterium]
LDYRWPGNVRELEQCCRNIIVRNDYIPLSIFQDKTFNKAFVKGELKATELLELYCSHLYKIHGSYTKVAEMLDMDRRTVKNHVNTEILKRYKLND